jgi:hypothetical protein
VACFPPWRPGFEPSWNHVGFVVDKAGLRQVFSEFFGFPYKFSFYRLLHTHKILHTDTIGQLLADVSSGLRLTPPQETKKKKNVPSLCTCGVIVHLTFFNFTAHYANLTTTKSRVFLQKPSLTKVLKNFRTFYGTWRFITVFARALHWSLSWARWILYQLMINHIWSWIRLCFRCFHLNSCTYYFKCNHYFSGRVLLLTTCDRYISYVTCHIIQWPKEKGELTQTPSNFILPVELAVSVPGVSCVEPVYENY